MRLDRLHGTQHYRFSDSRALTRGWFGWRPERMFLPRGAAILVLIFLLKFPICAQDLFDLAPAKPFGNAPTEKYIMALQIGRPVSGIEGSRVYIRNIQVKAQGEDDFWREMLELAYKELEKARDEYARNCKGAAASSSACKDLEKRIKKLEEAISGFTRPGNKAHSTQPLQDAMKEGAEKNAAKLPHDLGGVDFADLRISYVEPVPK